MNIDSIDWAGLSDAYGPSTTLPALLQKVEEQDEEAFDALFQRLCHQGSVYSASIAAFPFLIQLAEKSTLRLRADILGLAGAIYESPYAEHDLDQAEVRARLAPSANHALRLATALLPELEERIVAIYLWISAAAFSGFTAQSRVLQGFIDDEFTVDCPHCDRSLYIWPNEDELGTIADDPVSNPKAERIAVVSGPIVESFQFPAYQLLFPLAQSNAAMQDVGILLPHLFGTATCPTCRASFSLMDALVDYN